MEKSKGISHSNNYIFNKIKPIILFIFNFECVVCSYYSLSNHVHHINKIHTDNNPFNLTCVCEPCHKLLHSNVKVKFSYMTRVQSNNLKLLKLLLRNSA